MKQMLIDMLLLASQGFALNLFVLSENHFNDPLFKSVIQALRSRNFVVLQGMIELNGPSKY